MTSSEHYNSQLSLDAEFLSYAASGYALPSEDCIRENCCVKCCVLNIRRSDILEARKHFVEFAANSGESSKIVIRQMFLRRVQRVIGDHLYFCIGNNVCIVMIARIFGCSVYSLINDPNMPIHQNRRFARPVYAKTIKAVGAALAVISRLAEPNPTSGLLLAPSMTDKQLQYESRSKVSLSLVRRVTGLKIRRRTGDTLLRCAVCSGLKHRIFSTHGIQRRQARMFLRVHYRIISLERAVIEAFSNLSRKDDTNLLLVKMDAMSNRCSKLPTFEARSKSIADSLQVPLHLTAVQLATDNGANKYCNIDYVDYQSKYSAGSMYYLSLLFDALTKIETMPSQLIVVVDSCPTNKSDMFLGGLALLMLKCEHLQQINLLYHHIGHTHNSCDAHFGNLSSKLSSSEIYDPKEFVDCIEELDCVSSVSTDHTVYCFENLEPSIRKFKYRSSNNQITLSKNNGEIFWCSASYVTSDVLFSDSSNEKSFKFFKDGFDHRDVVLKAVKPDKYEKSKQQCEELFKKSGSIISDDNKKNYFELCETGGTKNSRLIWSQLNKKLPKGQDLSSVGINSDTIIHKLQQFGYKTNRIPQCPHTT